MKTQRPIDEKGSCSECLENGCVDQILQTLDHDIDALRLLAANISFISERKHHLVSGLTWILFGKFSDKISHKNLNFGNITSGRDLLFSGGQYL